MSRWSIKGLHRRGSFVNLRLVSLCNTSQQKDTVMYSDNTFGSNNVCPWTDSTPDVRLLSQMLDLERKLNGSGHWVELLSRSYHQFLSNPHQDTMSTYLRFKPTLDISHIELTTTEL